jgi:hypothetical protein
VVGLVPLTNLILPYYLLLDIVLPELGNLDDLTVFTVGAEPIPLLPGVDLPDVGLNAAVFHLGTPLTFFGLGLNADVFHLGTPLTFVGLVGLTGLGGGPGGFGLVGGLGLIPAVFHLGTPLTFPLIVGLGLGFIPFLPYWIF